MASQLRHRPLLVSPAIMNDRIASHLLPKRKGWAWERNGQAINFADPSQTVNLSFQVMNEPWWNETAPKEWFDAGMASPPTVLQVYQHLCLDHAERRITREQLAFHFRNLVAESIENWTANGASREHPHDGTPTA